MEATMLRRLPLVATPLLLLVLLFATTLRVVVASSAYSLAKSQHSNPVLPVVVEGKNVNLILTTDIDGIILCEDRPGTLSLPAKRIDYDYARKLLRYQLSGMTLSMTSAILSIPSLGVAPQSVSVGVFFLSLQTLSPAAIAFFLHHAGADGFVGVGYAFRLKASSFWSVLEPNYQYKFTMRNISHPPRTGNDEVSFASVTMNVSDYIAGQTEIEQTELDWSEPWASVDQADDLSQPNGKGLGFPVHKLRFQCATRTVESSSQASDAIILNDVDAFGDLTSHWDAIVDLNSPCLVLPQQFYNSLAGWTGLYYDEDAKVSVLPIDTPLPPLSFALTHQGPRHVADLNTLVLSYSNTTKSVCIQRSSSIVHNGASVFSPIDTELTAQRYRVRGTMMLPVYNMQQAPIVIGVMMIRALDTLIVDGEAKQVAMMHPDAPRKFKVIDFANTVPVCMSSPQCVGQQEFSPRLNICLDPGCQSYYFQHLDPETKVCVINSDWLMFLFTTVAVFVSGELLLTGSVSRMVRRATAAASAI